MENSKGNIPQSDDLRRRAEERLREKADELHLPRTEDEMLRLVHELEVHQIELEMQNAQLRLISDEAETALERYTDLYDFAPVGYVTVDRNGTISTVNSTGAGLIKVERSRLIGRRLGQFIADEDRPTFRAFLDTAFTSLGRVACEVALLSGGDAPLIVQVEGAVYPSGQECRLALIDITVRRQSEEALRQAKEAAEEIARAKSQFLANMSHELRTPMTGILGLLQLALENELDAEPRGYVETSLSSARSLLRILNDILDMARIESRRLTVEEQPFSLQSCIADVVGLITPEARRKGLDISFSVAKEVPVLVVGDEVRLRQILLNLISNAVKFTERGRVEVSVTASETTSDGKRDFTCVVTDTGIGIPDEKKELLFRPFSQVDESHRRRYGGTGLGLAISREIVTLMGGTIGFDCNEGMGCAFSFTIPLREAMAESDAQPALEPHTPEMTPAPEGERMPHLLLAEDDPTIRVLLEEMLKRSNYDLDIAADGQEVVEMWKKGSYDLVLMDVQMPRIDGYEATRAIREMEKERGGHTPIIAMTAHAGKEYEEICLTTGMDGYIAKPIDFWRCLQIVRQFIT